MARKSMVHSSAEAGAMEEPMANIKAVVEEDMKERNEKREANSEEKTQEAPLLDTDEIEVVSLLPNVSYKDLRTNDYYRWDKVGDKETMSYDVIKNLWRNNKAYFRNLWLKPLDQRVIKKLGLESNYMKYEFLMNAENYTRGNIDELCEAISNTPMGLKLAVCNKVQNLVAAGKVSDITVIRALERKLGLDLLSFFK